jgi:hypothetical protein
MIKQVLLAIIVIVSIADAQSLISIRQEYYPDFWLEFENCIGLKFESLQLMHNCVDDVFLRRTSPDIAYLSLASGTYILGRENVVSFVKLFIQHIVNSESRANTSPRVCRRQSGNSALSILNDAVTANSTFGSKNGEFSQIEIRERKYFHWVRSNGNWLVDLIVHDRLTLYDMGNLTPLNPSGTYMQLDLANCAIPDLEPCFADKHNCPLVGGNKRAILNSYNATTVDDLEGFWF